MAVKLPRIFLLSTHLQAEEFQQLEAKISTLTCDIREADIVLGKISKKERALFELRRHKLETEEVQLHGQDPDNVLNYSPPNDPSEPEPKKRKTSSIDLGQPTLSEQEKGGESWEYAENSIVVVKLGWLEDSMAQDALLPLGDYLLYRGRKLPSQKPNHLKPKRSDKRHLDMPSSQQREDHTVRLVSDILELQGNTGAVIDAPASVASSSNFSTLRGVTPTTSSPWSKRKPAKSSSFHREATSERDISLPPIPPFLHSSYSCQRPSKLNPPNDTFIKELKEIRTLRLLHGDKIGVRAYSTSIATLAAYPYQIQSPNEIDRLPGCGTKIAEVYRQWKGTGSSQENAAAKQDDRIAVLKAFYGIWGVGDTTARDFYSKGWRDTNDVVVNGWESLSRVQQIGVKYYDELQLKIPRCEIESIAEVILSFAREIDSGFQMAIVGGYRRGKAESGDVDVILSHPDESKTLDVIETIVTALEKSRYVRYMLSLWMRNSERGQHPLAWKGEGHTAGSGFDTLDKAMVVWKDSKGKFNSKTGAVPHRRVDIIISPWKTVGCAILGWSGETTFQRDLRRYCKKEKGLKFDSSGVRSRKDGSWIDLEGGEQGPAPDMETAEKRVFEGLGLPWRPPEERCTG